MGLPQRIAADGAGHRVSAAGGGNASGTNDQRPAADSVGSPRHPALAAVQHRASDGHACPLAEREADPGGLWPAAARSHRTVRRHKGAFITITQNIKDFDSDDASSASKAAWGNSAFKVIAKQDAAEFKTYCERNPTQFSDHERQIIERFGDAKDQWFSSFMLRTGAVSSFHRLFVDPLSRAMFSSKGEDFEFREARLAEGWHLHDVVYALAERNFPDEMKELEAWSL